MPTLREKNDAGMRSGPFHAARTVGLLCGRADARGVPVPEDRNSGEILGSKMLLAGALLIPAAEAAEAQGAGGPSPRQGPQDEFGRAITRALCLRTP